MATALEAELPVAGTAVGGSLVALLEAEFGSRRAGDLLRYLRGPSGFSPGRVDWLERALRRGRVEDAETALALWQGEEGEPPRDLLRLREAAARSAAALAAEVGRLAATMASRPLRGAGDGPALGPGDGLELRAAGTIASALGELAELGPLAPAPEELAATVAGLEFRVWSGPVEGRVRIASPYRLRAARFDHLVVGSLQDGEFPRRDRGGDPFLSEAQRASLGLEARRDSEAEERYLFGVCLSLPRRRLVLSYRDSDESGGAESRSPLLDDLRALLAPAPDGSSPDPVEAAITRARDLARVVHPPAEAPSEDELARALASHGPAADAGRLLTAVGVEGERAARVRGRIDAARAAEAASRAPGPLTNPAALAALAAVPAYGGTTLEGFDVCSYRWFVNHELDPQPLDPVPDPLVQGGLMHEALDRLYKERPGGDPLPRPGSLAAWIARGREIVAAVAAEKELGAHPAERAMARRVERLLERFLAEEAGRGTGGFEPWLLEAAFGAHEEAERPPLELGGWGLHGAIDRVDRAADGRALVIDYKLSGSVTPREKFEEQAKLQLPLYLLAVAEHWGAEPVGGLYHPLRGTSVRRPRGVVTGGCRRRPRRLRPLRPRRGRRRRTWRSCWRTRGGGPGRSSPACAPARSAATPVRGAACADTTSAPPTATSRRSAAATAPRSTRRTRKWRSDERAHPHSRAGGGDRDPRQRRPARGWRRHRQDRGDGRPLLPPRLREGRRSRRDPRLHLHRQGRGRAAPADPGRAGAAGRGGLRAGGGAAAARSAAPG